MIKFFKEMIESIKEGIEEGKQELAEERKLENADSEIDINLISELPYNESFGTSLSAPFRVVIFGDWFTVFKSLDNSTDNYYPIHLYSFGEYPKLSEHKKEFINKLKIDFEITDQKSCFEVLSSFFDLLSISKKETPLENLEGTKINIPFDKLSEVKASAVVTCIISHIATASTDVGYIDKKDALIILDKVIAYVKQHHNNWDEYSSSFIEGQSEIGLNNSAGTSVLKKYCGYLTTKKGSPWNNINW